MTPAALPPMTSTSAFNFVMAWRRNRQELC
jgi:hypothetical protein